MDLIQEAIFDETGRLLKDAVGLCEVCGSKVILDDFTCSCGADYNNSGQRLAPREHWGEETGEHWTDCI